MSRKRKPKTRIAYIPDTPAGTTLDWLEASTEEKAWENLMEDAAHMPYKTKQDFINRGYTIHKWEITE